MAANQATENVAVEHAGNVPNKPISKFTRWYRSPLFNVIIVGLISFTQPGIWNALNSMRFHRTSNRAELTLADTGAGGQQEPYLVNGANSLTFGYVIDRRKKINLT